MSTEQLEALKKAREALREQRQKRVSEGPKEKKVQVAKDNKSAADFGKADSSWPSFNNQAIFGAGLLGVGVIGTGIYYAGKRRRTNTQSEPPPSASASMETDVEPDHTWP